MSLVKETLSQSTIHGFPKIVTETTVSGRLLWLFLGISALGIFSYHSFTLHVQLQLQTINKIYYSKVLPFKQPDILICPKRFVAYDFLMSPPEQDKHLVDQVKEILLNNSMKTHEDYMTNEYVGWSSLDRRLLSRALFHRPDEFFMYIKCNGVIKHQPIFLEENWYHFACFRIRHINCILQKPNDVIEIILYIHTYHIYDSKEISEAFVKFRITNAPIYVYQFNQPIEQENKDGAYLYFVDHNHTIKAADIPFVLSGGYESEIGLTATEYVQADTIKNPCSTKPTEFQFHNRLSGKYLSTLMVSDDLECSHYHLQIKLYEKYQCVDWSKSIPTILPSTVSNCWNLFNPLPNMTNYLQFIEDAYQNINASGICSKMNQCTTIIYKSSINQVNWPSVSFLKNVVTNFVNDRYMSNSRDLTQYPGINQLHKFIKAQDTRYSPDMKQITFENLHEYPGISYNQHLIQLKENELKKWNINLYKIVIRSREPKMDVIEEVIAYTWKNFFSDCGGMLGFYVGASVLTVCEILAAFHKYLCKCIAPTNTELPVDNPPNNEGLNLVTMQ